MKTLSWITGILAAMIVIFAAMGSLCGTIDAVATDAGFYGAASRSAVAAYLGAAGAADEDAQVTAYIGITAEEQDAFAEEIVSFMKNETNALPEILNEKEQQHMLDVRTIVQPAAGMSKMYLTMAVALAVVTAWTGAKLKKRWLPKGVGALCGASFIMLIITNIVNAISQNGFAQMFAGMHEALFTNDLWLMNPATDILIRMMPQNLFEQTLLNGANQALRMALIVFVMLLAVHVIVERMIRRHIAKEK